MTLQASLLELAEENLVAVSQTRFQAFQAGISRWQGVLIPSRIISLWLETYDRGIGSLLSLLHHALIKFHCLANKLSSPGSCSKFGLCYPNLWNLYRIIATVLPLVVNGK